MIALETVTFGPQFVPLTAKQWHLKATDEIRGHR